MNIYFLLRHIFFAFVIFAVSATATAWLVRHLQVLDVPNERSSHVLPTPRGGGLAIVIAFLIGILMIHLIGDKSPIYSGYFLGFLSASFVIATMSLYDDIKHCSYKIKLAGHLLAIIVAMLSGIIIDVIALPGIGSINLGLWGIPLTLLWIFGLTNAYNFIDGLDGIAASSAIVAALFLSWISFQQGSHFIYLTSLTLAAATAGFLIFNRPPARIFMGDVGSTFLGLVFAVMAIIAARYDHSHTSMFVVPLLLFHFIFDTTFTFFRRMANGENVFTPHRSHLYQLLQRMGLSHGRVTALYSALAASQGLAAIWMVNVPGDSRVLAFLPFLLGYSFCAIGVVRRARASGLL